MAKLRPYRVDYFDISEMKKDRALVRSVIVRSATAQQARDQVLTNDVFGRIVIRSYRYYKNLAQKESYQPIEDLFSVNKAIEVMEMVEEYRKRTSVPEPAATTPTESALSNDPVSATHYIAPVDWDECVGSNVPPEAISGADIQTSEPDQQPCGTAEILTRTDYTDPDFPATNPKPLWVGVTAFATLAVLLSLFIWFMLGRPR